MMRAMGTGGARRRASAGVLLAGVLALCALGLGWPAEARADSGDADAVTQRVRALMERNGLRQQIAAWRPWMAQNAAQLRDDQDLPQRNREIAAQVLERMFDPAAVTKRVEKHLAAAWSDKEGAAVMDFLNGKVGRHLTEMEVASGDISTQAEEKAWKSKLGESPPPEERIALIVELDRAAWVSQVAVETWTIMSTVSALAAAAAGPRDEQIGPDQIEQLRDAVRKKIAEPIRQEVLLSMLFTYRNATAEELRAYIDFHETPAGQWYRRAVGSAMLRSLSETALEASKQIQSQVAL